MKVPPLDTSMLLKRREIIIADLRMKVDVSDWHGVQDCASDLRELEVMLAMLAREEH
jgi:hypothetical protein